MRIFATDAGDVQVDIDEPSGRIHGVYCRTHNVSMTHDIAGRRFVCTHPVEVMIDLAPEPGVSTGQDGRVRQCPVQVTIHQLDSLKQQCWDEIRKQDVQTAREETLHSQRIHERRKK
jgi:hypothetical protein